MKCVTPHGSMPLMRINGLYFIEAVPLPLTESSTVTYEVQSLSARVVGKNRLAHLNAARFHANSRGLRSIVGSTVGTGLTAIDQQMADAADRDTIVARSNMRRDGVEGETPPDHRATLPGERFIFDSFGPVSVQSIVDGGVHELEACCQVTGFGYDLSSKSIDDESLFLFCRKVYNAERALDHAPCYFRFDRRVATLNTALARSIERELGVVVELAPKEHHEGVGANEARNDVKQRMAEAMLMRSEKNLSCLLAARCYAGHILNARCCNRRALSRAEHHGLPRPDFTRQPLFLFGCDVAVLRAEERRGLGDGAFRLTGSPRTVRLKKIMKRMGL